MAQSEDDKRQQGVDGDWVCVGAFAGKHGVRGFVKLRPFTADPVAVFDFDALHLGPAGETVSPQLKNQIKGGFAVQLDGVKTPEAAQALNGQQLFVPRTALDAQAGQADDDDSYFLADLIGLQAVSIEGSPLGHIRSVENFGAEDLLEVELKEAVKGLGRFVFVPFRQALVPLVDIAADSITIDMDGWLALQQSTEKATDAGADVGDGTSD